jgi:hypothetical protein
MMMWIWKPRKWLARIVLFLYAISILSFADAQNCATDGPYDFETVWIFQLSAEIAATMNEDLELALELQILSSSFQCDNGDAFYEATNATLRLDLVEALFLEPIDELTSSASASSPFTVPVSVQGTSNLAAFEGAGAALFLYDEEEDDRRHSLRRELQGCPCTPPTKQAFLDALGIDGVLDVTEMKEVECAASQRQPYVLFGGYHGRYHWKYRYGVGSRACCVYGQLHRVVERCELLRELRRDEFEAGRRHDIGRSGLDPSWNRDRGLPDEKGKTCASKRGGPLIL